MTVKRIVCNFGTEDPKSVKSFYQDLLDLDVVMDHGWIVTFASSAISHMPQVSFASQGGSGTPVPDLSVDVDDVDKVYARALEMGCEIAYPLTDEPWGGAPLLCTRSAR
nr:VOC family protein [Kordiimonas aestuarii]